MEWETSLTKDPFVKPVWPIVLLLILTVNVPATTLQRSPRAIWVWDKPPATELFSFARANGVHDLFVFVTVPVNARDLARLETYRAAAAGSDIILYALGGEKSWAQDPSAATQWETGALATGAFTGAHFDVESIDNYCGGVSQYLNLLDMIRANSTARVEVDVKAAWAKCSAPGSVSLADAIIAKTDQVTVLSFSKKATGRSSIFALGQYWLLRGNLAHKPMRLAVDTTEDSPPGQTFRKFTNTRMQTVLATVDRLAAPYGSYRGIAIEDYAGWRALAP